MQLPPNVSPVSASFFGHVRQGIHLVLCVACSLLLGSCFLCEQEIEMIYENVILCFTLT
jgi:hypothetical protein